MTHRVFGQLLAEAVAALPERFQSHLRDVAIVVRGSPTARQRAATRARRGTTLLGLFEGTSRTERPGLPYAYPAKITLFRGAFAQLRGNNRTRAREEIARTLWHELGHYLGFPEARLRTLEKRGQEPFLRS